MRLFKINLAPSLAGTYICPSAMKFSFTPVFVLFLTVILLGQMALATYTSTQVTNGMELPIEVADEEDSDNEIELDKLFNIDIIENTDLSYSVEHNSRYKANLSELIQEILSPPPKA